MLRIFFSFLILFNILSISLVANAQGPQLYIEWRSPCASYGMQQTTDMTKVLISFSKPVRGIRAEDLTVNGFPAKYLKTLHAKQANPMDDGSLLYPDEETYLFTGFRPLEFGKVNLTLQSGNIVDEDTLTPFNGESWTCLYLDPVADPDNDGFTNEEEITHFTEYDSNDTDQDKLPDNFEVKNECLDPISDQRFIMTYMGEQLPGDDDADDDGLTDLQEFEKGTDPCRKE